MAVLIEAGAAYKRLLPGPSQSLAPYPTIYHYRYYPLQYYSNVASLPLG